MSDELSWEDQEAEKQFMALGKAGARIQAQENARLAQERNQKLMDEAFKEAGLTVEDYQKFSVENPEVAWEEYAAGVKAYARAIAEHKRGKGGQKQQTRGGQPVVGGFGRPASPRAKEKLKDHKWTGTDDDVDAILKVLLG